MKTLRANYKGSKEGNVNVGNNSSMNEKRGSNFANYSLEDDLLRNSQMTFKEALVGQQRKDILVEESLKHMKKLSG